MGFLGGFFLLPTLQPGPLLGLRASPRPPRLAQVQRQFRERDHVGRAQEGEHRLQDEYFRIFSGKQTDCVCVCERMVNLPVFFMCAVYGKISLISIINRLSLSLLEAKNFLTPCSVEDSDSDGSLCLWTSRFCGRSTVV